ALGFLARLALRLLASLPLGFLPRLPLRFLSREALLLGAAHFLLAPLLRLALALRPFRRFTLLGGAPSFFLARPALGLFARALFVGALPLDAREQRLVDDDGLDRERGRLRRSPEIDLCRERADDRPVQHDGPRDGSVTLAIRRAHAFGRSQRCSRSSGSVMTPTFFAPACCSSTMPVTTRPCSTARSAFTSTGVSAL